MRTKLKSLIAITIVISIYFIFTENKAHAPRVSDFKNGINSNKLSSQTRSTATIFPAGTKVLNSNNQDVREASVVSIIPRRMGKVVEWEALSQSNESYSLPGTSFQAVKTLRSIRKQNYQPQLGKIISAIGQEVIYLADPDVLQNEFTKPVVYDSAKKSFGILTGEISIKWENQLEVQALQEEYSIKATQSFDHLKLTYFHSDKTDAKELIALIEKLKTDPRVRKATLEIQDKQATPQ